MCIIKYIKSYYGYWSQTRRKSYYDMEKALSIPFDEPVRRYHMRIKPKYYHKKQSYMDYKFYKNKNDIKESACRSFTCVEK